MAKVTDLHKIERTSPFLAVLLAAINHNILKYSLAEPHPLKKKNKTLIYSTLPFSCNQNTPGEILPFARWSTLRPMEQDGRVLKNQAYMNQPTNKKSLNNKVNILLSVS